MSKAKQLMINAQTTQLWLYRLGYVCLCLFAYFIGLLPLDIGALHWGTPDLILGFAFCWVLRRPDYVPLLVVCVALLIADFLFTRPPGLWAAISLLAIEFLRRREPQSRDMPFLVELAMVAALLLGMAVAYRLTLAIFIVPSASLGLVILQQFSTLLVYPLITLCSTFVFRVTKITAAEADLTGHI
jgi:rod shape-determining protein MreD